MTALAIRRLSVDWNYSGSAEDVAIYLETLARKVRREGEPVDLRATLRYGAEKLRRSK